MSLEPTHWPDHADTGRAPVSPNIDTTYVNGSYVEEVVDVAPVNKVELNYAEVPEVVPAERFATQNPELDDNGYLEKETVRPGVGRVRG